MMRTRWEAITRGEGGYHVCLHKKSNFVGSAGKVDGCIPGVNQL